MTRVRAVSAGFCQNRCYWALRDSGMEVRVPDVSTLSVQRSQLRMRILEAQQRKPRRYGTELKQAIAAYGLARRAEGASNRVIAGELGLSVAVVASWLRHAERRNKAGKTPFERFLPDRNLSEADDHGDRACPGPSKKQ